ncbi:class 3 lipase protein [Aphelenchoides avenae]|nr:class 3 lipase protein [Aphelenchus avenae]
MLLQLALCCALLCTASAAYNDSFARTQMLYLSAAAWSQAAAQSEQCLQKAIPGAQVTKSVVVDCGSTFLAGQCAGIVGVAPNDKAIFVAFRGTGGFVQLLVEVGQTALTPKVASPVGGQVSSYFLAVFNKVWSSGLAAELKALQAQYPSYQLWVTGHSLGGAMASIGAALIAKQGIYPADSIRLVTFGQPRTGDAAYARAVEQLLPESYRVTHGRDLVPHSPPYGFAGYQHHKTEVWYNNFMTANDAFSQCDNDGLTGCSNPDILNLFVPDHLFYFGVFVQGVCPGSPIFTPFK